MSLGREWNRLPTDCIDDVNNFHIRHTAQSSEFRGFQVGLDISGNWGVGCSGIGTTTDVSYSE